MLKLAAFSLLRRGHLSHYSKVLAPLLVKSTSSASITSWQSTRKTGLLAGTHPSVLIMQSAANSSGGSERIVLNYQQKKSALELLKVFDEALNVKTMVYLLGWLGRMAYRSFSELDELQKESSNQGRSVFIQLLNCINDNISELEPRELAVVVWSLGRIKEGRHPLIEACEKEILSRGIGTIDCKSVSQIALGFSLLRMRETSVFEEIEKAILCGVLDLAHFDLRGLAQTIVSFVVSDNGSSELFAIFSEHILSREFSTFQNHDLAQFAWSFAKKEVEADHLFEKIESELFRRGISEIVKGSDIGMILWSFASAKQGSQAFFQAFGKQILKLRNLKGFKNGDLSQTIWALATVRITSKEIFDRLEHEAKSRGIKSFNSKDCKMLIEGFTCAGRGNQEFLTVLS